MTRSRSIFLLQFLFALNLVGLPLCTFAASFDCRKATTSTEKLICSDAETSALDSKLQQTYRTALMAAEDAPNKKTLTEEQRGWLVYSRNICEDIACLRKVYAIRIGMLARNEKIIVNDRSSDCIKPSDIGKYKGDNCLNLVIYRDPNEQIKLFNQAIIAQKQNGKIIGCSRLINMPMGTVGGENTFGGICTLQDGPQRKDVGICYGDMGGAFQMHMIIPQDNSDKYLIGFTYSQCFASPNEL